jgi:hypothetical protein
LPSPYEDVSLKILVSLPHSYPSTSPPQLQLLSKYIGAFSADSALFGSILRTYISINGTEWTQDTVCVFDGLQNVLERCLAWYEDRLNSEKAGELARDDLKGQLGNEVIAAGRSPPDTNHDGDEEREDPILGEHQNLPIALPTGVHMFVADPLTDRKSVFVGRACQISHPSEVSNYVQLKMRTAYHSLFLIGHSYFILFNVR